MPVVSTVKNEIRNVRRLLLVATAFALVWAFGLTQAAAASTQDPRQPDSYNSNSGVPAERPVAEPSAADSAMSQKIRKAIAADKSLSGDGRRVKVTTKGGKVTLQGAARSEAERTAIFTKAAGIAGGANVVNNIKISPQH